MIMGGIEEEVAKFKEAESISADDLSMIEKFKSHAANFWQQYKNLQAKNAYVANHPDLQEDYANLLDRGSTIRTTIETVTAGIDKAVGWVGGTVGVSGVQVLNGLGFLPVLALLVSAGGLALIGKWVSDAYAFNKKVEEMKRLEAQGMTPQQASAIVGKLYEGEPLITFGKVGVPLVALAVLFAMWKFGRGA
jgi:hypothetical protein